MTAPICFGRLIDGRNKMQAPGYPSTQILKKWILLGGVLAALLGAVTQLHALQELVDRPAALFFASQRDTTFVHIARFLTDFGKGYWFIVPAAFAFLATRFFWRRPLYASQALFVLLSVSTAGIITDILKVIFGRARPSLLISHDIYQFFFFRLGSTYNSFPSGHTACAMAAGTALALAFPKYRALMLTSAIILACTRFIVTAHFVSDVVASSMISVVVVLTIRAFFVKYGLPIKVNEETTLSPYHNLAVKMIGAAENAYKAAANPLKSASPAVFGIIVTVVMVTCGLIPDLMLVEWQEHVLPNFEPGVEWWLWLSLYACISFGMLTWAFQRFIPKQTETGKNNAVFAHTTRK